MPRLTLALLGRFEATLDGEPLPGLTSGRSLALLAYLAVEADRAHARRSLAELLWPGHLERAALDSLRHVVATLRTALRDQMATTPLVLTSRDTIRLNPSGDCWLDVAAFTALIASEVSADDQVDRLERAAALYRGPFLEGFSLDSGAFDDWMAFQRERYARQLMSALERLAEIQERRGDLAKSEGCRRRQLSIEPWREEAHRELMRLLALEGQRTAALAQFEVCKRLLRDELDVEPARETISLHAAIRDGTLAVGRSQAVPRQTPPVTSERTPTIAAAGFVARDRELAWLDDHLSVAIEGQGRIAFVVGEAGSGKTALLSELSRRAMDAHPDLVVVSGSCNAQTGLGDPYLPFRDALRMLSSDVEAKRAGESVSPDHARRLWALLPDCVQALVELGPDLIDVLLPGQELLARAQALGPPSATRALVPLLERLLQRKAHRPSATLQQSDLFEQVSRVLRRLSARHPLVILLDDLQWADRGSVSLLFHLGRRLAGARVLMLGAYRPDDVTLGRGGERHPLEPVVNELQRDLGGIVLHLSDAEGRAFVDALLDTEPNHLGEDFREALYARTEGHALFTVELLRGLVERSDLVRDEAGAWVEVPHLDWRRLPVRVEAVIAERLGRLPRDLQGLLRAASVEGEEFTAEVLARALGEDEREVLRALSGPLGREHRLVAARSVRRVNGRRVSVYRFRHQLFQQYLYDRLDDVERAELHERVGLAMEELYTEGAGEISVQLAWHFEEAGAIPKALSYLLEAGTDALCLSANAEALSHFGRALEIVERLPASAERDRRKLDILLAAASPLLMARGWGSPELATAVAEARELAESLGETDKLRPVLGLLSFAAIGRAQYREAIALGRQLLAVAGEPRDGPWLSVAHRLLGTAQMFGGELLQAREHAELALRLYGAESERAVGRPLAADLTLICAQADEVALWMLGYTDQSERRGTETLRDARDLGDPDSLRLALTTAGAIRLLRREYRSAQSLVDEAVHLAGPKDEVHLPAWLAVLRGRLLVRQGQPEEGLALMRRGIDGWLATGTVPAGPFQFQLLADACLEAGHAERGMEVLRQAKALAERCDAHLFDAEYDRLEGEMTLVLGGDGAESVAESRFRRALEVARQQEAKSWELRAACSLARLWRRQGRSAEARDLLAPIYAWFAEGFDTPDLIDARKILAEL